MKLLLATTNKKKILEIEELLSPLNIDIETPASLGLNFEVEETGLTFKENAALKSEYLYNLTKIPSLADDSGICVSALGGRPGVYSARYGEPGLDDRGRAEFLLKELGHNLNRDAYYVCCLAYTTNLGTRILEEECHGKIHHVYDSDGKYGFGYDPIFFYPPFNDLFSRIPLKDKNLVSHRGKALRSFYESL